MLNEQELVNALVGTAPSKQSIYQPGDSPAVKVRRRHRERGPVDMFSRTHGEQRPDRIIFDESQMIRFDRAYNKLVASGVVGKDGEIDERQNRQMLETHEERHGAEDDGEGCSAPQEAPVESTEYVRQSQEPSSRLPKTNVALNCEETTALYARRRRN